MSLEALDLVLEILNIIWQMFHSETLLLTTVEAGNSLGMSIQLLVPENTIANSEDDGNDNEGSKHSEPLGLPLEEFGKTKKSEWDDEENNNNVNDGEEAPVTSSFSKAEGSVDGDSSHERDWVENKDTGNVEEQVAKSDLE